MRPEDQLWGIWEEKWFKGQVKTFGLNVARRHLQEEIDKKATLRRINPREYHRHYCGTSGR